MDTVIAEEGIEVEGQVLTYNSNCKEIGRIVVEFNKMTIPPLSLTSCSFMHVSHEDGNTIRHPCDGVICTVVVACIRTYNAGPTAGSNDTSRLPNIKATPCGKSRLR